MTSRRAAPSAILMARWAAEPYAAGGKLVLRRLTEKGIRRLWSAATRRQKTAPPYLGDFVEALLQATGRPRGVLAAASPVASRPDRRRRAG
jgi:hypothetical protein